MRSIMSFLLVLFCIKLEVIAGGWVWYVSFSSDLPLEQEKIGRGEKEKTKRKRKRGKSASDVVAKESDKERPSKQERIRCQVSFVEEMMTIEPPDASLQGGVSNTPDEVQEEEVKVNLGSFGLVVACNYMARKLSVSLIYFT